MVGILIGSCTALMSSAGYFHTYMIDYEKERLSLQEEKPADYDSQIEEFNTEKDRVKNIANIFVGTSLAILAIAGTSSFVSAVTTGKTEKQKEDLERE